MSDEYDDYCRQYYDYYRQYCEYYMEYQKFHRERQQACSNFLFLMLADQEEKNSNPKLWVHPWIARRNEKGLHHNLFMELMLEDPNRFRRCLRMDTTTFEELVVKVAPLIQKQDTVLRRSIPPAERLSLTLRHLATGETQESLSLTFRIGQSTISGIIKEVCHAITTVLRDEHLRFPSSEAEWKVVARDFGELWNFENCVGAIDGKHVKIEPPLHSGSMYFCYKDFFSIVLMAVVDAHLRFIYI